MLMELKSADLEERFRTRVLYAIQPEELAQCKAEMADACQVTAPPLSSATPSQSDCSLHCMYYYQMQSHPFNVFLPSP